MSLQFGASNPLSITAANLGSGANRSSAAVTVSTDKNINDILLTVSALFTYGAQNPTGNKQLVVYGYCSEDGTNYNGDSTSVDNVDGTDKVLTNIGSPTNLKPIGTLQFNQAAATSVTVKQVFSLLSAFGFIPAKWGIVLYNDLGTALGATIGATYREQYYN